VKEFKTKSGMLRHRHALQRKIILMQNELSVLDKEIKLVMDHGDDILNTATFMMSEESVTNLAACLQLPIRVVRTVLYTEMSREARSKAAKIKHEKHFLAEVIVARNYLRDNNVDLRTIYSTYARHAGISLARSRRIMTYIRENG
jgi:hypothetical protein